MNEDIEKLQNEIRLKEKEINLLQVLEYRRKLYREPELRHLFLELTSRCNAKCDHCGSRCDAKEQGEEISTECLKKTLKEISEHYNPADVFLNVTGGEPLMRKDFFDILEYAVGLGYNWGMTSNGMLIDEEMVQKLEKAKMCTVSISIDGLEKTHELFRHVPKCYGKILHGIDLMQQSDVIQIVQVTTVVNKMNIEELDELYKLLLEHGIKYWRVVTCDPIGRANDNNQILLDKSEFKRVFDFIKEKQAEGLMNEISYGCSHFLGLEYEREIRNFYFMCMTGLYVGSILSNGDIFVCPNVPRRPELIQGNIKTDSFVEVWEKNFKPFRHEERTCNDTCRACKYFKYCGGDSFHTWNFDENKPNICLKELFDKENALNDEKTLKKTAKKTSGKKTTTKKTAKKSTKSSAKKEDSKVEKTTKKKSTKNKK